MERDKPQIRPYRPSDLDDLYRICLLTGDNGGDATSLFTDPMLLGHLHAAPYGVFEPSLAFVAEDMIGVGGYVVGALDTRALERRLEAEWWPGLRDRYPEPSPDILPENWTRDQRAAHGIHHPWRAPEELVSRYPSHLHINIVPRLQARGLGRDLITTLIAALRERGSLGVHLGVRPGNRRAVGFYRHLGFTEQSTGMESDGLAFGMDVRASAVRPDRSFDER